VGEAGEVSDVAGRLESVDLVRGAAIVLMALDHARDFFHESAGRGDPETIAGVSSALFATRWATHVCAPTFVFLAGTGAFLALGRGRDLASLRRFLLTRGLFLCLLEATAVKLGWFFTLSIASGFFIQVIGVLGVSMVALAALTFLPVPAIAALGGLMVVGHNAFDGVAPAGGPALANLWRLLHVPGPFDLPAGAPAFIVRYPLVPWVGVMALGYAFGPLLRLPRERRRPLVAKLGAAAIAAFVALRASNLYGDPRPFRAAGGAAATIISFFNAQKYPPSLLFLLMTLGPMLVALAALDREGAAGGPAARPLVTLGRVPLFFYLAHVPFIHLIAALWAYAFLGAPSPAYHSTPAGWGFGLPVVYGVWAVTLVALYPLCRRFAALKARRRDLAWLSYF
jgi:uncharacterized membrane protein